MLTILLWTSAGLIALSILAVIGSIDKPRKPITHTTAVTATIINSFFIIILILAALR